MAEKASRSVVAAHVSRAKGFSDLSIARFGHERYIDIVKSWGLWNEQAVII